MLGPFLPSRRHLQDQRHVLAPQPSGLLVGETLVPASSLRPAIIGETTSADWDHYAAAAAWTRLVTGWSVG
jgi:hypothetical protein